MGENTKILKGVAMLRLALSSLALVALALACAPTDRRDGGAPDAAAKDGGATSDASFADAAAGLQWYSTCGDPVCSGHTTDPSVSACTDEEEGQPCSSAGARCDPVNDCNSHLLCAAEDPKEQPGGCPISRRAAKREITYLGDAELQRLANELFSLRLARYAYAGAPEGAPKRLGFLIDDHPKSPAVLPNGRQVDVYGYTSMAVAALKTQAKQIERLEREVAALRAEIERLRARR